MGREREVGEERWRERKERDKADMWNPLWKTTLTWSKVVVCLVLKVEVPSIPDIVVGGVRIPLQVEGGKNDFSLP